LIHQEDEAAVVDGLEQVNHFLDDDVFQAFKGFLGEFGIDADACCFRIASAPSGFHALDKESVHADAQEGLPFGDQRQDGGFYLVPEPGLQDILFLLLV